MTEVPWQFQVRPPDTGTSFFGLTLWLHKRARCEARHGRWARFCRRQFAVMFGEEGAVKSYRITLRDRETQTVVGYYDGSWTTDRRRALDLSKREVAEAQGDDPREDSPDRAIREWGSHATSTTRPPRRPNEAVSIIAVVVSVVVTVRRVVEPYALDWALLDARA
jgi:hypothetical protein